MWLWYYLCRRIRGGLTPTPSPPPWVLYRRWGGVKRCTEPTLTRQCNWGQNLTWLSYISVTSFMSKLTLHNKSQLFWRQSEVFRTKWEKILRCPWLCQREQSGEKWPAAPIWKEQEGRCEELYRYLKVWCITIGLSRGAEASCTIGQVRYCLLGEGALDDAGVIAILLWAGGSYTYTHGYIFLLHSHKISVHESH